MSLLTSTAMTILGIQRLLPTQLILDLPAMTASLIADVKIWVIVMDSIGRSEFPRVQISFRAPGVAIIAVCTVGRDLSSHCSGGDMGLKLMKSGGGS